MADRKKVIRGLTCCQTINEYCDECPYNRISYDQCTKVLIKEAREALHDQERQIAALKEKLRLLEYGNQDAAQIPIMPAT